MHLASVKLASASKVKQNVASEGKEMYGFKIIMVSIFSDLHYIVHVGHVNKPGSVSCESKALHFYFINFYYDFPKSGKPPSGLCY